MTFWNTIFEAWRTRVKLQYNFDPWTTVKEFKADIDLRNNENYTAADLAQIEGYELIYRYLNKKMEDKRKCLANLNRSKSLKNNRPSIDSRARIFSGHRVSASSRISCVLFLMFYTWNRLFRQPNLDHDQQVLTPPIIRTLRQRPTTLKLTNDAFVQSEDTFQTFDRTTKTTSTTLDSFDNMDQQSSLPFNLNRWGANFVSMSHFEWVIERKSWQNIKM